MGCPAVKFSGLSGSRPAAPCAAIAKDTDRVENWSFAWARSETIKLAPRAFAGASCRVQPTCRSPKRRLHDVTLPDHVAYVDARDAIKREQLAKAARADSKATERYLALSTNLVARGLRRFIWATRHTSQQRTRPSTTPACG